VSGWRDLARRPVPALLLAGLLAPAASIAQETPPAVAVTPVVRLGADVGGRDAVIEIADLDRPRAESAARAGFAALARAGAQLDALVAAFAQAGEGPVRPSPEVFDLLVRADSFCRWSVGAVSALGGNELALWGVHDEAAGTAAPGAAAGRPGGEALEAAIQTSACERMAIDGSARTVRLAAGSRLDLAPFAAGWAVDRAAAALGDAGTSNFRLALGPVVRGVGKGPEGKGWRVEMPAFPGQLEALEGFYLRDRSAAILRGDDRPIVVAGDRMPRWLDMRRGYAPQGTLATAAVTDLAVDAQGVAWAMFALGQQSGEMSLGQLRPAPSVLWVLGGGDSPPVLSVANWAAVPKR
jgi:thiamine biosynthesis lipoprotein ApbE